MADEIKPSEGTVNVEELKERLAQLESTNSRLLEESKDYKSKYSESKSRLDAIEKESIDKSGDIQKKYEFERERNKALEERVRSASELVLDQNIKSTLKSVAHDAIVLEDILALARNDLKLGIDKEKLTLNEDHAKEIVTKLRKERPHLFRVVTTEGVDTTKPKVNPTTTKDYSQMSSREIMADIRKSN